MRGSGGETFDVAGHILFRAARIRAQRDASVFGQEGYRIRGRACMTSRSIRSRSNARPRELPTFYYHTHFLELLDFVSRHYQHVLNEDHAELIRTFKGLDPDAQRLYVRLANRKGRIFAINRLRYPEIGPLCGPLEQLRLVGWVGSPGAELFEDVLSFLTRDEIYRCVAIEFGGVARSMKKGQLVEFALANCVPEQFMRSVSLDRLLVQQRTEWVQFMLFLYFGECRESLSRFTLRDMGMVRTHSFTDAYQPRFADREEAAQAFYFASRLKQYEHGTQRDRQNVIASIADWPEPASEAAADLRDRLALATGRDLERAGQIDAALATYRRADSSECDERIIRLLLASGQRDAARAQIEACLDSPRNDGEWMFANDLYQRKFGRKRTTPLTDVLRAAETVDVDEAHSGSPERAAILHFARMGHAAFRAENTLWRTLFGLLFWDELFDSNSAALHSPFEAMPASLKDGTFYACFTDAIERKLARLADVEQTKRRVLKTSTRHFGTSNGIFRWRRAMLETVFALLDSAEHNALATMLGHMCRQYMQSRDGFPDLLVVENGRARFVEIKAEGDQLRRNQLVRLQQMRDAGFVADVLRLRWILDPLQTYVVVDVETTGGSGDQHRITEVAAVKLRDGVVIDRYQTLLNPQRLIPPKITRLTGISNAMVSGAPVFADIADEFSRFMGDAIFVAHNVSFDYGFISREYARIGRRFRHAKLCTCASMRKLYPGHGSYSLAALCQRFDIELKRHHRAMCDAEAAAELLLLVNEKRAEALSGN